MLTLERRRNEWIHIGENIRVCVTTDRGHRYRIGIEAPPDVKILRAELVGREPTGNGRKRNRKLCPDRPEPVAV